MAETETLTIFLEMRPRRDVGKSRDRDHNPACTVQTICDGASGAGIIREDGVSRFSLGKGCIIFY